MPFCCRPVDQQDFARICGFPQNAEELFFLFPKAVYPLTPSQLREAVAQRSDSTVVELDGKVVAFANFYRWKTGGCCAIANVVVAPVVAPATVSGVLAALLSTVWPTAAGVVVLPACWAARWIAWVSTTLAGWPGAALPWPEGVPGAVLLAAATLTAWAAVAAIPAFQWFWQDARVRRRRHRAVARSRRDGSAVRRCR